MATRKSHNVGVRNHHPNVAPIPAGSEGTVNPSAVTPVVPSAPAIVPTSGSVSVGTAVETFKSVFEPIATVLTGELPGETPGNARHCPKLRPSQLRAIPLLTAMARKYPSLSGVVTVEDIDAAMSDATATEALSQDLGNLHAVVDNATRLRQRSAWLSSAEIMALAERKAINDANIARDLATVHDILALGTRKVTAAHAATTAQQQVSKARAQLTRAQERAAAKAAAAEAAQHATPDVVIVPATTGTPGNTPTK